MTDIYDECGNYFFTPRQLGATAPANPEVFAVDHRDTGQGKVMAAPGEAPIRTFDDPTLTEQLGHLMTAGLQVEL